MMTTANFDAQPSLLTPPSVRRVLSDGTLGGAVTLSVSIDIGGTFTDLSAVIGSEGRLFSSKCLTTHENLTVGVFKCLEEAGLSAESVAHLVHGSTIAINIAIERKGAKTALIVTKGTRDVYEIGRSNRPHPYDPFFRRPKMLVPRELIFEVNERHLANGEALVPLTEEHVLEVAAKVAKTGVEAVAVCFLHSYSNPAHEASMGKALRKLMPNAYVTLSHEIVREYREYERTSTTLLNAYVGPSCAGYVAAL